MGLGRWVVILKKSLLDIKSQRFSIGSTGLRFTLTNFLISRVNLRQASFLTWRCSAIHYRMAFESFSFFSKQSVIPIMWIYCSTLCSVQVNDSSIFTHTAHCPLVCSFVNIHNRSWVRKCYPLALPQFGLLHFPWTLDMLVNFNTETCWSCYWNCIIPKDQFEETDHLNTLTHQCVNMVYRVSLFFFFRTYSISLIYILHFSKRGK